MHENSISAILAYFLAPKENHGLGSAFLETLLQLPEVPPTSKYDLSNAVVKLEEPLANKKTSGDYYIDIELILPLKDLSQGEHWFLIENKIRASAAKETQLNDYYEAYREKATEANKKVKIFVVFIAPASNSKKLTEAFNHLKVEPDDASVRLYWQDKEDKGSVQKVIRDILKEEAHGKIAPIYEYVKYTLKAFAMHLGQLNKEETQEASGFTIIRRNKQAFEVYKGDKKVIAKSALREIIKDENLGITDINMTTYKLGGLVWKALKTKRSRRKNI